MAAAVDHQAIIEVGDGAAAGADAQTRDQGVDGAGQRGPQERQRKGEGHTLMLEIALAHGSRVIEEQAVEHGESPTPLDLSGSLLRDSRYFFPIFALFVYVIGMNSRPSQELDAADLRILGVLQEDAALSVAEVAERVNLSQNACWRRIKRLEEDGIILRRVALLNAQRLEAGVTVFATIRAAEHSDAWLAELTAVVRRIPEIVEFYRMSGDIDYLLKIKVADIAAYDAVYKRLIHGIRLSDVSSAFAMEELKSTTAIPLPVG